MSMARTIGSLPKMILGHKTGDGVTIARQLTRRGELIISALFRKMFGAVLTHVYGRIRSSIGMSGDAGA